VCYTWKAGKRGGDGSSALCRCDGLEVTGSQDEVAYLARSQGRMLISRNHRLAHRPGLRVILVEPTDLAREVALVIRKVGRLPPGTPPRCMRCNEALVQLNPEQAQHRPEMW